MTCLFEIVVFVLIIYFLNTPSLRIYSLSIIFLILPMVCFYPRKGFCEEDEGIRLHKYLDEYKTSHNKIMMEIKNAQTNSNEVYKYISDINRLDKLIASKIDKNEPYENIESEVKVLTDKLFQKYAVALNATFITESKIDNVTSKDAFDKILSNTYTAYNNTIGCFDPGNQSNYGTCAKLSDQVCNQYGAENGNIFYNELTEDFDVKKITVVSGEPSFIEQPPIEGDYYTISKDNFYLCRLKAITLKNFKPNRLGKWPLGLRFIEGFWGMIHPTESSFKEFCIEKKPSDEKVRRLIVTRNAFPGEWILDIAYRDYNKWNSDCSDVVNILCGNTYVIKNQVILAYETMGCEIREVTKEDVVNDFKWFDTNAQRLNHSKLLDYIAICQEAHNKGFSWYYLKPELSAKCKKTIINNKKPSKKKKK